MRVGGALAAGVLGYQHLLGQRVTAVDGLRVFCTVRSWIRRLFIVMPKYSATYPCHLCVGKDEERCLEFVLVFVRFTGINFLHIHVES